MAKKAVIGDNSVDAAALKGFIDRLETLDQEKAAIQDDMKDVKKEARDAGLDPKTIDRLLKLRKVEANIRRAEREMLDAYLLALGME